MCGIFCYCGSTNKALPPIPTLMDHFNLIKYRGPEASEMKSVAANIIFGFHRLAIMDTTISGMQPMTRWDITVVANCDIYNWQALAKEYKFKMKTKCDTEILLHMYRKFGIAEMLRQLDGHFALCIYDKPNNKLYFARDPYGVRSMYIGQSTECVAVASELKVLDKLCTSVTQFPPGHYAECNDGGYTVLPYHNYLYNVVYTDEAEVTKKIRELFTLAVYKRTSADREMGCLLSGGLDSSLVTAMVQKIFMARYKRNPPKDDSHTVADDEPEGYSDIEKAMLELKSSADQWQSRTLGKEFKENTKAMNKKLGLLKTFTIGMPEATDLRYARMVAEWIGSDHREIIVSPADFLASVPDIIWAIESYDVTTVRASVGNYIICVYVRGATQVRVLFNGDGSDELFASYKYLEHAPNDDEYVAENAKLMRNIHYFDVLRSDKCLAGNGIENRSPFLDKELIEYCMQIAPGIKRKEMEKFILRKAFDGTGLLPDEVLWRRKEAFSDGVSSKENSWHDILTKHIDTLITDNEFAEEKDKYEHNPPTTKEALYYRRIFEKRFQDRATIIPYKWMPNEKWFSGPLNDPSARTLPVKI